MPVVKPPSQLFAFGVARLPWRGFSYGGFAYLWGNNPGTELLPEKIPYSQTGSPQIKGRPKNSHHCGPPSSKTHNAHAYASWRMPHLASSRCKAIESYCLFEPCLRDELQTQKRLEARRRPTGAARALPCECF